MQASERFGDAVDHDADGLADELTRGDISALVIFQATLPPPVRVTPDHPEARAAARRGETLFSALECSACHIPELPLNNPVFTEPNPFNPAGKLSVFEVANAYTVPLPDGGQATGLRTTPDGTTMVPVFTDLKRHDMGDILNNETLEEEKSPPTSGSPANSGASPTNRPTSITDAPPSYPKPSWPTAARPNPAATPSPISHPTTRPPS